MEVSLENDYLIVLIMVCIDVMDIISGKFCVIFDVFFKKLKLQMQLI
jgi:hypothetical protein